MKAITVSLLKDKSKTVPILTFPSAQLLGINVKTLVGSPEMQAKGMKAIVDRCEVGAALNMMDLSVEAEAFGAKVRIYDDEIPAVEKGIIDDISQAGDIVIPEIGVGRTATYIEGIKNAKQIITEVPVFCGVIGPYSLAGRLFDMTELMLECYDSPDEVKILLEKCVSFITDYIKAFKNAGADGVVMAEPAAGLLSPTLAEEFSTPFVKKIIDEVNDPNFIICYHNCGSAASDMLDDLARLDADIYHFGNAVDLKKACEVIPTNKIVMGNVDPVLFRTGTPQMVEVDTERTYELCGRYENFMISTGCDVPAASKWENIDAYFEKVKTLYA